MAVPGSNEGVSSTVIIIVAVIGGIVLILIGLGIWYIIYLRKRKEKISEVKTLGGNAPTI